MIKNEGKQKKYGTEPGISQKRKHLSKQAMKAAEELKKENNPALENI